MKVSREKIIYNLFYAVILFFMALYYFIKKDENIIFYMNVVTCILTCIKSKTSIFSLKSILILYVMIAIFSQYNYNHSYGLLELNIYKLEYETANLLALIYNMILFFFVTNTNVLKLENMKKKEKYSNRHYTVIVCSLFAIAFAIIAFPSIPFLTSNRGRFDSLLPGHAWNHVMVIFLLFAFQNIKEKIIVKMSFAFCIIWFLLHGERVDMIGILIGIMFITISNKHNIKQILNKMLRYIKYFILIFIILVAMVLIGENRNKENQKFSLEDSINKVLVQSTASDVGFVYNTSIIYTNEYGLLNGKSYLSYIKALIPFTEKKESAGFILGDHYPYPGGIFILSEPYMNFGIIGVIIFELLELIILYRIIKSKSRYSYFLYLYILVSLFRTNWYGISYIETGVIYILPLIYFGVVHLNKYDKRRCFLSD